MKTIVTSRGVGRTIAIDPATNSSTMVVMDDAYPDRENYFHHRLCNNIRIVEMSIYRQLSAIALKYNTTKVIFSTATKAKDSFDWMVTKYKTKRLVLP